MSAKFLLVLLLALIVYRYWRRFERGLRAAARSQARPGAFGPGNFGSGAGQGQWANPPGSAPHPQAATAARAPVIQDLVPCPSCGSYIASGTACTCAPAEQRRRG